VVSGEDEEYERRQRAADADGAVAETGAESEGYEEGMTGIAESESGGDVNAPPRRG
jgi:hypothetical protein